MKYYARQVFEMYESFAIIGESFSDIPEPTVPGFMTFLTSDNNKGLLDLLDLGKPKELDYY